MDELSEILGDSRNLQAKRSKPQNPSLFLNNYIN